MLSGYPGPFEARIKYKANNILASQFMCVWRTIDNIRKIVHAAHQTFARRDNL